MPVFFGGFTIWSLILLVVGLGFLTAEILAPGFGIMGVIGIVALGLDILLSARTAAQGVLLVLIAAVIVLLFLVVGARMISKGKLPRFLVLRENTDKEQGFSSSEENTDLLDKTGSTITVLRPAGIADFSGKRMDVVTRGEFVDKGAAVRVIEVEGSRIVVCPIDERS